MSDDSSSPKEEPYSVLVPRFRVGLFICQHIDIDSILTYLSDMKEQRQNSDRKGIGGRPSKFSYLDLAQVRMLAERGWTDREMSNFFQVTEQTWNNWKVEFPEFFESLKEWKKHADERVERSLYERAIGYSHPDTHISSYQGDVTETPIVKHYPPDTVACIFWLKNRQPEKYRDKQEVEHSGLPDIIIREPAK